MNESPSELEQQVERIRRHGTPEEQLPRPGDGVVKVLSADLRNFVEEHSEFELIAESFSFYGQIETDYFAADRVVEAFDKPQATIEEGDEGEKIVVHYTTDVA